MRWLSAALHALMSQNDAIAHLCNCVTGDVYTVIENAALSHLIENCVIFVCVCVFAVLLLCNHRHYYKAAVW